VNSHRWSLQVKQKIEVCKMREYRAFGLSFLATRRGLLEFHFYDLKIIFLSWERHTTETFKLWK
jgi:hypothetical protein